MKKRRWKKSYTAYSCEEHNPCWTFYDTLNFCKIFCKKRRDAVRRYDCNEVIKYRITIEEI